MTLQYQTSGQYPGGQVQVVTDPGVKLWFGSVQVQGPASYTAQSGTEWIIFASQPRAISNAAGGVSGAIAHVGVPQRVRWATVTGGVYVTGSSVIQATIASGGLPDLLSGGRYSLSGIIVAGALTGTAIGLQWLATTSGFNTVLTQGGTVGLGLSGIVNAVVSGQNVGLILVGE